MNDTPKTIAAKPVPFRINHNLAARLPDQVADGFRQAIVSGYYRKGDVLPRFADIAKTLGVSLRIPREAIAVLAAENLVSPRPRLGCMVLGRDESFWRGRVLAVVPDVYDGSYYVATLFGEMRRRFAVAGYLFLTVTLDRRQDGAYDFGYLDVLLKQKFDFVFPLYCPKPVLRRIGRAGARWTSMHRLEGGTTFLGDVAPFLKQCRDLGVRRVFLMGSIDDAVFEALERRLVRGGLSVEGCNLDMPPSEGLLERLSRRSMEIVTARFSRPRETWPDLVLWSDDFLAFGGLTALLALGVRLPEDVYAVTLANKGFGPVNPRTITRFEFDPVAAGRAAVANILDRIAGRPAGDIRNAITYIVGESFPRQRPPSRTR